MYTSLTTSKNDLEKARETFPGGCVPDPKKQPQAYRTWVKRIALWGYANGPFLLNIAEGIVRARELALSNLEKIEQERAAAVYKSEPL